MKKQPYKKYLIVIIVCIILIIIAAVISKGNTHTPVPDESISPTIPPSILPSPTPTPIEDIDTQILDSIDNTPYGWGVVRNKNHTTPQISADELRILSTYNSIYHVETQEKILYLTFNLGYESGSTEAVLDRLRERNIKAVFFLTGDYVNDVNNASIINRIKDEGHLFGNHGYTHTDYTELSSEAIVEDYNRLSNVLYEKYSVDCSYVRPPYCKYSERVVAAGSLLSYKNIFWSIAFDDYGANKGKDYAYNTLMNNLHPGAIILIHPTYSGINDYFEDFLDSAMGEGYKFELLQE